MTTTKLLGFRAVVATLMMSPLYWTMSVRERLDLATRVFANYLA